MREYALRWLLVMAFMAASAGCNLTPRGVHQVGNWGPVKLLEDGAIKSFYTKQLCENRGPMLLRIESLISYSEVLTENATAWKRNGFDDRDAQDLWTHAPQWRRQEKLEEVAKRLTADVPKEFDRYMISIHGPVVVGTSEEREDRVDGYFMLLSQFGQERSQRKITRLFVCRQWPTPDATLGLLPERRIIDLPQPMSVEELLEQRPWEPEKAAANR